MYGSESIYALVPKEYTVPVKPPMHKSYHDPNAHISGSTFGCRGTTRLPGAGMISKKDGALFGPSKIPPVKSLRRSPSPESKSKGQSFHYDDRRKGPIPPKDEKPVMGIKTTKNFITANAVEAILQVPRVVEVGELNYLKKEDYGKSPAYLEQVKEEIRRENEMIEKYVKEQTGQVDIAPETFEEVTEEERQELLNDLKAKWDNVNANYQKITHLVQLDTTGQIRRKETLEGQLDQLEKNIQKLMRPGPILLRK